MFFSSCLCSCVMKMKNRGLKMFFFFTSLRQNREPCLQTWFSILYVKSGRMLLLEQLLEEIVHLFVEAFKKVFAQD